jgi:hypothetical protein
MAKHGMSTMLELLAIPSLEQELECRNLLDDMRHLAARGDSFDSINMFICESLVIYYFLTYIIISLSQSTAGHRHWARVVGYGPFSLCVIHKERT